MIALTRPKFLEKKNGKNPLKKKIRNGERPVNPLEWNKKNIRRISHPKKFNLFGLKTGVGDDSQKAPGGICSYVN